MPDEALMALLTMAHYNLAVHVTKVDNLALAWRHLNDTLVGVLAFTDIQDFPTTSIYYQYWHAYGIKFAQGRFVEGYFRPNVWDHKIRSRPPCYLVSLKGHGQPQLPSFSTKYTDSGIWQLIYSALPRYLLNHY